jgi:hypothetical protein
MAMQGAFFLGKKALSFCALLYTNWRIAIIARRSFVARGQVLTALKNRLPGSGLSDLGSQYY